MLIQKVTSKWFRTDVQRKPSSGDQQDGNIYSNSARTQQPMDSSCLLLLHHTCQVPRLLISNPPGSCVPHSQAFRNQQHCPPSFHKCSVFTLLSQQARGCLKCGPSPGALPCLQLCLLGESSLGTISFLILPPRLIRDRRTLRNAGSAFLLLPAQISMRQWSQDRQKRDFL